MAAGSKGTGNKKNSNTGTARKTSGNGSSRNTSGAKRSGQTSARRGGSRNTTANSPKSKEAFELQNEITLMVTLVVSLLLLLSHFNLGGAVGGAVNGVMFGLFGLVAYLVPFLLFFGMAFYLANRGNRVLPFKMLYAGGMVWMVMAFVQLCTKYTPEQWSATGENARIKIIEYFTLAKTYKKGGGFFGGLVVYLFDSPFGRVGSFLVVIALFLVCFMLFSRKAIFAWIRKKSNERYALHKVHAMERRESFEQRQAERERLVEEKRRELSERRAKTFLLSDAEKAGMEVSGEGITLIGQQQTPLGERLSEPKVKKEKKKETRNFFGGKTPTGEYTLDMNNQYTLPEKTVSEVNALYGEERKAQQEGLRMMEIVPETGEYKETTYVERPKRPDAGRRGPTVAEQLEALGPGDRATSGGQALWGNSEPVKNEESTKVEQENIEPKQEVKPRRTTAKSSGEAAGQTVEPLVIEESEPIKKYEFPPVDLLTKPKGTKGVSEQDLRETAMKLQSTLDSFGVRVTVTNVSCGPAVTRYELQPEQGVKVSKITSLADDIKLNLAAADVRIEAPIPGKAAVGIEVPNKENSTVLLRELLESSEFTGHGSNVAFAVGKDIGGQTVVTDIAKMPHLLIAGATGSGKSVCINTLIMSILYKADPSEVKLIMVDPKVVELSVYNGIPHLMIPVVTDPKKASAALNWAVIEMTERYQKFAELGVRDLKGYNERVADAAKQGLEEEKYKHLPQIVIIVDELADLMMVAPGEVEDSICRLAQLARAAGLHLVIATQRPSVNVITGLIKANIPSRIAFAVSSAIDSRTILDGAGAEKLLGKGDMLFFPSGYSKPVRVQGAFVSDREVSAVVDFLKANNEGGAYNTEVSEKITNMPTDGADASGGNSGNANGYDEYFADAGKLIIEKDKASIGMLQRAYKIGFNRAARIMDQLAEAGVVGPEEGTKPRKVLMSAEEFEQYIGDYV